jgi:hypothetical protein
MAAPTTALPAEELAWPRDEAFDLDVREVSGMMIYLMRSSR